MDQIQLLERRVDAFLICAGLVTALDMIDSAHFVGPAYDLKATVGLCCVINSDHATGHVRKKTTVVVPVAIILMPRPCAADPGLF